MNEHNPRLAAAENLLRFAEIRRAEVLLDNARLRSGARLLIAAVAALAFALVTVGVRSVNALERCEAPIVITTNPGQAI